MEKIKKIVRVINSSEHFGHIDIILDWTNRLIKQGRLNVEEWKYLEVVLNGKFTELKLRRQR